MLQNFKYIRESDIDKAFHNAGGSEYDVGPR